MKIIAIIMSIFSILGFKAKDTAMVLDMGIYPKTAMVFDVDEDLVSCKDYCGNVWQFYSDAGDWKTGELVSLLMCDNGTRDISDDVILDVQYAGVTRNYRHGFRAGR